ncbi:purine-cytosine permease family protein [Candidatus Formimonas warabiya]|uniref:Cytosine permease n=1 Tax=Formimonas warabiya TaxID=1761012 RepID=A0A3G1KR36_FORW1|nr:cytosine permease [Candidatus Formimonas warabiya]ATW24921.1 cytosine permease [Candidatus Formimonas warabiya]
MEVEQKSIEYITEDQRHGKVSSLVTIWFGMNMIVLAVTMGTLASTLGLNLAWSLLAIILGNCFGALFMAFHSAQGPQLGIPQMIQSRAQFGVIGAVIPLVLVIIMYLGYFASNSFLAGQTLGFIHVPITPAIIIANIVTLIVCIYGYDVIHFVEKWVSILFVIVFAIVTYFALRIPLPEGSLTLGPVDMGMFLLAVSIYATWQITYAPYVADYSRYLPSKTKVSATFWATYGGTVTGAVWMMVIGAILAAKIPGFIDNPPAGIGEIWGLPLKSIVFITMILGIMFGNSMNLYGAFMSLITTVEPFTKVKGTRKNRIIFVTAICLIGTAIAIWGSGNFLTIYTNFLALLLFFMIPWTAINLVDFYFLKHGHYNIDAIFDPDGEYGRYNWRTLFTYFITVVVEIPFINTAWYQGPFSKALGGADIAWIVGGIFSAVLYYFLGVRANQSIPSRTNVKAR